MEHTCNLASVSMLALTLVQVQTSVSSAHARMSVFILFKLHNGVTIDQHTKETTQFCSHLSVTELPAY